MKLLALSTQPFGGYPRNETRQAGYNTGSSIMEKPIVVSDTINKPHWKLRHFSLRSRTCNAKYALRVRYPLYARANIIGSPRKNMPQWSVGVSHPWLLLKSCKSLWLGGKSCRRVSSPGRIKVCQKTSFAAPPLKNPRACHCLLGTIPVIFLHLLQNMKIKQHSSASIFYILKWK